MPTIYREGSYRFFFNSREETRMHIHVQSPDGACKFWLEPIIALADVHLLTARELVRIQRIIEEHQDDFIAAWHRHFNV
jgi:hypothetical protein